MHLSLLFLVQLAALTLTHTLPPRAPAECKEEPAASAPITSLSELGGFAQAAAPYVVGGSAVAHGVCLIVNHGQGADRPCAAYAEVVAGTLLIVLKAAGVADASTGTGTSGKRQASGPQKTGTTTTPPPRLADMLAAHMADGALSYERVEALDVGTSVKAVVGGASDGDGGVGAPAGLVDGVRLYGVRMPGMDSEYAEDHVVKMYADGTGFLRSTPSSNSTAGLGRRHDGAGFKYNWQRFDYNGGFLGEPDLRILPDLSGAIASNWAVRSDSEALDQFFAVGAVDHLYSFGLRIIAETDGFGEEYEDVNYCGDLSGRAHDELRRR